MTLGLPFFHSPSPILFLSLYHVLILLRSLSLSVQQRGSKEKKRKKCIQASQKLQETKLVHQGLKGRIDSGAVNFETSKHLIFFLPNLG